MVRNPNLIFYACVAKGSTILAEFNAKDADLGALAAKCLEITPPFHSIYSHTVRNRTYAFLIDDPFTYFGIFDGSLDKSDGIAFLKSVKDAFTEIADSCSGKKRLENLRCHSFQGEFSPVFHRLLSPSSPELDGMPSPREAFKASRCSNGSFDFIGPRRIGAIPLLTENTKNLTKKKKRLFGIPGRGGEPRDCTRDTKVDVADDESGGGRLSRGFSPPINKNGLYSGEVVHQKAKHVWKKHVWVVLSLDLTVCIVLFIIWLCICRGFECVES